MPKPKPTSPGRMLVTVKDERRQGSGLIFNAEPCIDTAEGLRFPSYSPVMAMYVDPESGHVKHASVSVYSSLEWIERFRTVAGAQLNEPQKAQLAYVMAAWARREANADLLDAEARAFLNPDDGEAAWWFITGGWPTTIDADGQEVAAESLVEGSEVGTVREWLVVKASADRTNAFYDTLTGRRIISSTSSHGFCTNFTPAGA